MKERDEKRSILLPLKALKMEGNRMAIFCWGVFMNTKSFVRDLEQYGRNLSFFFFAALVLQNDGDLKNMLEYDNDSDFV